VAALLCVTLVQTDDLFWDQPTSENIKTAKKNNPDFL